MLINAGSNILEKYALNIQHWKDLYYQKNKNTEKSILKKFNSNYKEVKDEDATTREEKKKIKVYKSRKSKAKTYIKI